MHIQEHIISNITVFKITDSAEKVLEFFQANSYSHVAVEEDGRFLGMFSENDAETLVPQTKLEDFRYELEGFFVRSETNWLDVLEAFARNEANLLPIVSENGKVNGYYDLADIVSVFIDTPFFTDPGSILVVATGINDYSFSEIAQIVESNNARLIGGFITDSQNDVIQVTLKITTNNYNKVVQTFRRYNYHICLLYTSDAADDLTRVDIARHRFVT